ncbi:thioredoxin domain-containing protein [Limibacter armeniacum]|uniref:thioredoxin family protein n=1 Tax=Limibacter armeniacum TaxID=466084 RepID=UPI002FE65962
MMKKVFVCLSLMIGLYSGLFAQGVDFQHISLEEALEKAKQEDKLVFVDFYTVWCGPCKYLVKHVFPVKEVGDFYNKKFVSLKLDAEKEGLAAAKQYEVYSYPTLLFLTPEGTVVYTETGGMQADSFIALGKKAIASLNSEYSLAKLKELYPARQQDEDFLKIYFQKMIEYGEDPAESIEQWLAVQTEIKENGAEMMEFILKYSRFLRVDGKSEAILNANIAEYSKLASKIDNKRLSRVKSQMLRNTREKAIDTKDPELMKAFLENWEELPEKRKRREDEIENKLMYYTLAKDGQSYMETANSYIDSLIASKPLKEIKEEDQTKYERYKKSYDENPTETGAFMMPRYEIGVEAFDRIKTIYKIGTDYLEFAESKKDYKNLESWIKYGYKLNEGDYTLENLEAKMLYKRGKTKEAIELKKSALEKWPKNKKRPTAEYELEQMLKKQA